MFGKRAVDDADGSRVGESSSLGGSACTRKTGACKPASIGDVFDSETWPLGIHFNLTDPESPHSRVAGASLLLVNQRNFFYFSMDFDRVSGQK
jgi:hypothetical protein